MSHRHALVALLASALIGSPLVMSAASAATPAHGAMPTKKQWYADVRTAMSGSQAYVDQRVAAARRDGQGKLAINLDIDNTSLATHYDRMRPIPSVRSFVRHAKAQGVTILFNTGRVRGGALKGVRKQLRRGGFTPTQVCGRTSKHERLAHSKQRCRAYYVTEGYTIIANVGNRSTDFVGANYERAFRLPNYGNRLG